MFCVQKTVILGNTTIQDYVAELAYFEKKTPHVGMNTDENVFAMKKF